MERDATLREELVELLGRSGALHQPAVAAALRAVPRHRFLPELPLDEAYADRAVAIKTRGEEVLSSVSQPGMLAQMLEMLDARPGSNVLEIGTGSGYTAALLAELCGPGGVVTTIDLDEELVERARETLALTGYARVRVRHADGARASDGAVSYDRILVTARSDDVASGWWDELARGGRLVVPLRLERAGEYAVGFIKNGDRLESVGVHPCAFIALRGDGAVEAPSDLFFRDPSQHDGAACVRRVASVVGVRRTDATPQLLEEADVVIARPVTLFGVRFV